MRSRVRACALVPLVFICLSLKLDYYLVKPDFTMSLYVRGLPQKGIVLTRVRGIWYSQILEWPGALELNSYHYELEEALRKNFR